MTIETILEGGLYLRLHMFEVLLKTYTFCTFPFDVGETT